MHDTIIDIRAVTMLVLHALRWTMELVPQQVREGLMPAYTVGADLQVAQEWMPHLPQDVLCQWLQTMGKRVDVQQAALPSALLPEVVACMPSVSAISELHVTLDPEVHNNDAGVTVVTLVRAEACVRCCVHGHDKIRRPNQIVSYQPETVRITYLSLDILCPNANCGGWAGVLDAPVIANLDGNRTDKDLLQLREFPLIPGLRNVRYASCNNVSNVLQHMKIVYGSLCTHGECEHFRPPGC